ncbi:MAG: hypothetical protein LC746_11980 [Acidobacteria bacterium]|nr:hypothetical protein [Acidobacteriota bacterium]
MNDTTRDVRPAGFCPRCGARLRAWGELGGDEREVARRLPASADFTRGERERRHRWCTRCWHEEARAPSRDA